MRKIRIGKDIHFAWKILTNGEPIPLDGRDLKMRLRTPVKSYIEIPIKISKDNTLTFSYFGTDHKHLGNYTLSLWENYGKEGQTAVDKCDAFRLVATTCEEDSISIPNLEMATVNLGTSSMDITTGGSIPIEDAPRDGKTYGRNNGEWTEISEAIWNEQG